MPKRAITFSFNKRERKFIDLYLCNARKADELIHNIMEEEREEKNGVYYSHSPLDKEEFVRAASFVNMDLGNYIDENGNINSKKFEEDVKSELQAHVNKIVYGVKNRLNIRKVFGQSDKKKIEIELNNTGVSKQHLTIALKNYSKLKWKHRFNFMAASTIVFVTPMIFFNSKLGDAFRQAIYGKSEKGFVKVEWYKEISEGCDGTFNCITGAIQFPPEKIPKSHDIHHELRHAKNSEAGEINIVDNEVSARLAEELYKISDSTSLDGMKFYNGVELPYNIKYYVSNEAEISGLLEKALIDWDKNKSFYENKYGLTPCPVGIKENFKFLLNYYYGNNGYTLFKQDWAYNATEEQKFDSVFTFNINNKRINLYRAAQDSTQAKMRAFQERGKYMCLQNKKFIIGR